VPRIFGRGGTGSGLPRASRAKQRHRGTLPSPARPCRLVGGGCWLPSRVRVPNSLRSNSATRPRASIHTPARIHRFPGVLHPTNTPQSTPEASGGHLHPRRGLRRFSLLCRAEGGIRFPRWRSTAVIPPFSCTRLHPVARRMYSFDARSACSAWVRHWGRCARRAVSISRSRRFTRSHRLRRHAASAMRAAMQGAGPFSLAFSLACPFGLCISGKGVLEGPCSSCSGSVQR